MLPAAGAALGALLSVAFPPYDLPGLGLLALPLLIGIATEIPRRTAGWMGLAAGLCFFGIYLRWLGVLGWYALVGAVLVQALFFSAFFYLTARLNPLRHVSGALAAGGIWAFLELVRGSIPFGGFPWGTLGSSLHDLAGPRRLASVVGTSGLSALIVVVSCLLWTVARGRSKGSSAIGRRIAPAAMLLLIAAAAWLMPVDDRSPVRSFNVAMVQAGIERPVFSPADPQEVLERHIALTRQLVGRDVDLVLWGEGVLDSVSSQGVLAELALEVGAPIAAGAIEGGPDGFSNLVVASDGEKVLGRYAKQHPVPFGEYVPMRWLFGRVPVLAREIPVDMVRGGEPAVFDYGPVVAAPVISFESTFASIVRGAVNEGAMLLQVHTNNSTFGRGPASRQHLSLDQMRAAELGIPVARIAITGVSAAIDAGGGLVDRLELFETGMLVSTVKIPTGSWTLYRRFGDLLFTLPLMGWAVVWAIARQRGFFGRR